MPTFTTIALETLLEPRNRDSYKNSSNSKQQTAKFVPDNVEIKEVEKEKDQPKPSTSNHIYISPALYITPQPTPILDSSPGSLSPSPYVVNRKGRGGNAFNRLIGGFESNSNGGEDENGGELQVEEMVDDGFIAEEVIADRNENSIVDDDFFNPRYESQHKLSSVSNQGEFFDANEDFSSDGSSSNVLSCGQSIESELRVTRLSLLEEIERRKTSEDALGMTYNEWQRFSNLILSQAGLTFPTPSNAGCSTQLEINSIEQFAQEVVVARFVAEAIGKGQARAEAELAAEAIIESKDQETSRLRIKLQYYEAVNREMSQRNQEVMEVARRQRQRKKVQQRWLWGCIGLSIAIGASVIAYSCLPQTSGHHPLSTSSDRSDASCISSSESA